MKKIAIVGVHGTGKSKICEKILTKIWCSKDYYSCVEVNEYKHFGGTRDINIELCLIQDIAKLSFIPEQFREVIKDLNLCNSITLKQTEEITLATYAKQLYLENLHTAQGKNILCDRSVLDTFVYYNYFRGCCYYDNFSIKEDTINTNIICKRSYKTIQFACGYTEKNYSKIYLIEPSDREIESDGLRMTDKKQQLEIHQLFLEYFKGFKNVEIINQEEAHKEEFIEKVTNELNY